MEQTEKREALEPQKQPTGYRVVDQMLKKEEARMGLLCFHVQMPNSILKIVRLDESTVKAEIWNEYQSKFKQIIVEYADLYVKMQLPTYD